MQSRLGGLDRASWYSALSEAWPSGKSQPDAEIGATHVVIRGTVIGVETGKAFGNPTATVESPEIEFESDALWRTLHLDVEITEVLAGTAPDTAHVRVGLAIDGDVDPELMRQGMAALGDVVLFLSRSPVFAYDPELYSIVGDGALTAEVTDPESGSYALIFLPHDEALPLLGDERMQRELASG